MTTPDVTVEVESNEPAPESGDTVVVVAPPAESDSDDLAIGVTLGRLVSVVETMQADIAEMRGQIGQAQASAEVATDIAVNAVDIAIEAEQAAEEAAEEAEEAAADNEEVIEPDREHWLWKRRGGLKPVDD